MRLSSVSSSRQASNQVAVRAAIHRVIRTGFTIGREVTIGIVHGTIIGYNIARSGRYTFRRSPLLITTDFGIGKYGPNEVKLV